MTSQVYCEGSYYLEVSTPPEADCSRSIVSGIVLKPSEDRKDGWGFLIYQDVVEERQRIIPIALEPTVVNNHVVTCISQLGQNFIFSYLDYDLWMKKGRLYAHVPPVVAARLNSTEAVQSFFKTGSLL